MKTAMGLKDDSFPFGGTKSLPRKPTTLSHQFEPSVHVGNSWYFLKGFVEVSTPFKGRVSYFVLSRCLNSSPRVDFFFHHKNGVMGYKLQTKNLVMADVRETSPTQFVQATNHSLTHHRSPCLSAVSKKIRPQPIRNRSPWRVLILRQRNESRKTRGGIYFTGWPKKDGMCSYC